MNEQHEGQWREIQFTPAQWRRVNFEESMWPADNLDEGADRSLQAAE